MFLCALGRPGQARSRKEFFPMKEHLMDAAVGLRAKTGRAIAVVLAAPIDSPVVLIRVQLTLTDPKAPATSQPYHEVLDLPWEEAKKAVIETSALIEAVATRSLSALLEEARAKSLKVRGAGIVGAGDRNLEKIGSTHIRAHAAEGVLFRHALQVAVERNKIAGRSFPEREIDKVAASELGMDPQSINRVLAEMGRSVGSPWRADEKAAALGAWLCLRTALKGS